MSEEEIRDILKNAQTIAVVGHSDKPERTSYRIAQIMGELGYLIYPVNPTVSHIDGKPAYPSLDEIPTKIDIVNVFRRSEHLKGVVEEAIKLQAPVVWAQLGVYDEDAARLAEENGIKIVMDRCIKVAYQELLGV
jgi:hypothetical protein